MEVTASTGATETATFEKALHRDTPAGTEACLLYKFVFDAVVAVLICLGGLVGNTLTCLVMWGDSKKSATALALVVLAMADNAVLLVYAVLKAFTASVSYFSIDSMSLVSQYFSTYGWALASPVKMIATWSVVLVAIVRFISVCLPHKSTRWLAPARVRVATGVVVVTCTVVSIPRFLARHVVRDEESGEPRRVLTAFGESDFYVYFYLPVYYWVLPYVIPLAILVATTYKLIRYLAEARKKKKDMVRSAREQYDVTFSLVIVILVFVTCHLASPIRRVWADAVSREYRDCPYALAFYTAFSSTTPVINSAVNFISYVVCSRRFRLRVTRLVLRHAAVNPTSYASSAQTDVQGQSQT